MNLSAPINQLKNRAKKLRRSEDIPLNQALARIAKEEGYSSWGLLIRDFEARKQKPKLRLRTGYQITSFPLEDTYRKEAIEIANRTFEMVMRRIGPDNPIETRGLWDAEEYVDHYHLSTNMLPIDSEYAHSLIESSLFHYVVDLAVQADHKAKS